MVQKEIINILEEKIKDLEEFISAGRGYISTKEYEEMIETLYSAIEVFEMWPISYDVSESVKPKTQKIKLSEIREIVKSALNEKWKGDAKVEKTGEHADKTIAELKKELKDLKEKSKKYQDQDKKVPKSIIDQEREIVFAIRAKTGWKKGKGAIGESQLKEAKQDYETYHNSFTDAATDAREMAEKRGYTIDEDDWWNEVASGGRYGRARPAIGKTHKFTVGLLKDGKPQRKALIFTVYGMESGRYELVAYIN